MKNYRLHFHPQTSPVSMRESIVKTLMAMHEKGAWPRIVRATGMSKKDALKKSCDLSRLDAIQFEIAKVVNERQWPNLPTKSYWSEEVQPGDRFVIRFSSNWRGFTWHNMMHIEIPERLEHPFLSAVFIARQSANTDFIIMELNNASEISQVSTGDGKWYSSTTGSTEYRRLISLVGFKNRQNRGAASPNP